MSLKKSNGSIRNYNTGKNSVISPDFLVWTFYGKAQFPHSFGRFAPGNFHTRKSSQITLFFAV